HLSALTPSRDHEQHRALTRCSSKKSESKQRTGVSALHTITSFTVFRVRHRRRNGRHRDLLDRLPDVLLVLAAGDYDHHRRWDVLLAHLPDALLRLLRTLPLHPRG